MTQILNISFLNPLKFVPSTNTPGYPHFDADWAVNQIKIFETNTTYYQKWQVGDTTPIQIEASSTPWDLKVYSCDGVEKSISFSKVADGATLGINIYEAIFDITDLAVNKIYYALIGAGTLGAISEPVRLQTSWDNTMSFSYKNSLNDFGVAFTTGVEFTFRCEAGIMDFQPETESTDYIDQIHNVELLAATPYREFKLYIGDERGVAPWVLDLLNRIFSCDNVHIEDKGFTKKTGSQWDINRIKGWPLFGGSLDIVPKNNVSGLQLIVDDDVLHGLVTSYDIDTNFFGTAKEDEHILDIETTD